jgi:TrmH family RNA methyltransferase
VAARRLTDRAARSQTGLFLVEGPQGVREALAAGAVQELFCTPVAAGRYPDLVDLAGSRVSLVTDDAIAGLAETVTPQGIVAVCAHVDAALTVALGDAPRLVAVLAEIRDPGNAGTVLRTADAAGADAVVFSAGSVDPYNGKCVRAAAGSLFHLGIVRDSPLADAFAAARAAGLRILAATGDGAADLDNELDSGRLGDPTAWVFGNEAWGTPAEELALADSVVRVPIYGRAESLNLATAAALCLYASARAQHAADRREGGHDGQR